MDQLKRELAAAKDEAATARSRVEKLEKARKGGGKDSFDEDYHRAMVRRSFIWHGKLLTLVCSRVSSARHASRPSGKSCYRSVGIVSLAASMTLSYFG